MPTPEPLAIRCAIPNTGNPIAFAGAEGESGSLKLQIFASGDEIERLLELRGRELVLVLQEATNQGGP